MLFLKQAGSYGGKFYYYFKYMLKENQKSLPMDEPTDVILKVNKVVLLCLI